MTKELLYAIIGFALLTRGSWGIYRYLQGRGIKTYHFPSYKRFLKDSDPWYIKYLMWVNTIIWSSTKKEASTAEKIYLLTNSILQIIVGLLFFYVGFLQEKLVYF